VVGGGVIRGRDAVHYGGKKQLHPHCLVQIRLLMEMVNVPPWSYYPLTLQILSSEYLPLRLKCPDPPSHIAVNVAPLEVPPPLPLLL